ncbi:hypothetical protein [Kribbella sp. NPDC051137]|uniref:hypothetical protein n=1 Tax=Kribbella sp. NPDC051137 TaxID=3155045 RepID=UPI00342627C6
MLMRFDPFRELDRMSHIDGGLPQSTMPIAAYRGGDQFVIRFDLLRVDRDSIDLAAEKNILSVRAEHTWKPEEGQDVAGRRGRKVVGDGGTP